MGFYHHVSLRCNVSGVFHVPDSCSADFLPIAEQIFQELNYGKGNRVAQMIVLGLGIAVGIGSANTPLGHAIILIRSSFFRI